MSNPGPLGQPPHVPPTPAPGWQPAPVPGAAPARRRGWLVPVLVGVAAVVVLCCGGAIAVVATGDTTTGDATSPAAAPASPETGGSSPADEGAPAKKPKKDEPAEEEKPKAYGVGDPVRGGDFQFTVHGVKCGLTQVGTDFLNKKAQGSYCRVSVTTKNMTKKAQMFHADNVLRAEDGEGREYKPDGVAAMYGNDDAQGFLDEINPGNSVRANVFFDVPKGVKLKTLVFDAGLFTLAEDAVVTL
ncbi:DUF4352 domain-containing protein [Micromonospora sp. NPDC000207]|uniref:DUF4352 domain-containing protein n=1 Tax=Micromonospora sp. NPDC000207 TaxID=3154246 RepID=UPI00331ED252